MFSSPCARSSRQIAPARRLALATLAILGITACLTAPVRAQNLFVTSDATILGGNPINSTYDLVDVGEDEFGNPTVGVDADIVTGANITTLGATNNSTVSIYDGTITNAVANVSAINVYGGTIDTLTGVGGVIQVTGGTITSGIGGFNGTTVNIGGLANVSFAGVDDVSSLSVTGGTLGYVAVNGIGNISGGNFTDSLDTVEAYLNSVVTITGGTFATGFVAADDSTVTVNGSGLNAAPTGNVGYFDPFTGNNLVANSYQLTGTLTSGDAINTSVYVASGVSGDTSSLTFAGAAAAPVAPDLFVTDDGAPTGIYNNVFIGQDETGTVQTSPTVTLNSGLSLARVDVINSSVVDVNTDVPDELDAENSSTVNINASADVDTAVGFDTSKVNVNGGTVGELDATDDGATTINSGTVGFAGADTDATVTVNGGSVDELVLFEGSSAQIEGGTVGNAVALDGTYLKIDGGTMNEVDALAVSTVDYNGGTTTYMTAQDISLVNVNGGTIGTLDAFDFSTVNVNGGTITLLEGFDDSTINVFGGSIDELAGYGGKINLLGGLISDHTIYNLRSSSGIASDYSLLGSDFQLTNGVADTYFDGFDTWTGVLWHLTGNLQNGDTLDTFYFEAFGSLGGPNVMTTTGGIDLLGISAPEPGSIALILIAGVPFVARLARRKVA